LIRVRKREWQLTPFSPRQLVCAFVLAVFGLERSTIVGEYFQTFCCHWAIGYRSVAPDATVPP
jgi:hypothetical protein